MSEYYLNTSNINEWVDKLQAGDRVYLCGTVYTARDAAHKRIVSLIHSEGELPFDLKNAVVYYAGPTPQKNSLAVGSIGPTTSSRMDVYASELIALGLKGMIGKGNRSQEVVESMMNHKCVYFAAIGGAGALYAQCVEDCQVIAFEDLGCESVKKLTIKDFPVVVAIDAFGNSLYK